MSKYIQWYLIGLAVMGGIAAVVSVVFLASSGGDWEIISRCECGALGVGFLLTAGLAGSIAVRRGGWGWIAIVGCWLSLLMAAAFSAFIGYGADYMERWGGHGLVVCVACAIGAGGAAAGLFCLGPLIMKPKWGLAGRLLQWGTLACLTGSAVLFELLLLEVPWSGRELEQAFVMALILSGAGGLFVWAMHRLAVGSAMKDLVLAGAVRVCCARCGKEQEVPLGDSRCAACGVRMRIWMEEPVCLKCGYRLYGKVERCPECGTAVQGAFPIGGAGVASAA
jgi:hypothetical protein